MYAEAQRVLGRRGERQIEALSSALTLDPAYVEARIERAIRRGEAGETEAAEADFKQAIQDDPFSARSHFNYGVFLAGDGRSEAAIRYLDRAVKLEPDYGQALYALVDIHVQLGRIDEAREWYGKLASRVPDSPKLEPASALLEQNR